MVKEQDVVKIEDDWNKRRFFTGKRFVFFLFLLIAVSLLVYAFYGSEILNITGGAILDLGDKEESNASLDFDIRAELGELHSYLNFNQDIEKIYIELKQSDASLYFGKDGSLNLSDLSKTTIEIKGFKGTLAFDKEKIYTLNGNVFELSVNELSTSSPKSEMKVSISNELNYESIELDSVNIKKYESTSEKGKVIIDDGRASFNLNEESFSLSEFFGKVESGMVGNFGIKKQGLILDGKARGINVGGKFKIDVKS